MLVWVTLKEGETVVNSADARAIYVLNGKALFYVRLRQPATSR